MNQNISWFPKIHPQISIPDPSTETRFIFLLSSGTNVHVNLSFPVKMGFLKGFLKGSDFDLISGNLLKVLKAEGLGSEGEHFPRAEYTC